MKHRPKDLLDTLSTGEDKVTKINSIKDFFREKKLKISVRRRKLAKGEKIFFYIEATGPQYDNNPQGMWGKPFRLFVLGYIKLYFPNANITSVGTYNVTVAEY